jgi:hypothetical protein
MRGVGKKCLLDLDVFWGAIWSLNAIDMMVLVAAHALLHRAAFPTTVLP